MSRVLSPTGSISGSLSDGGVVVGSFSDLAKPIDGGWVLKVNLAKSGDCPASALIQLFQDQDQADNGEVIIVSTTVTPTSTAQDYEVSISEEQLSFLAVGRCHLSEVKVRVKAITPPCSNCMDCGEPPALLVATFTSSPACPSFDGCVDTLTFTPGVGWDGDDNCLHNMSIRCSDLMVNWFHEHQRCLIEDNDGYPSSFSCDPFKIVYTAQATSSCCLPSGTTVTITVEEPT